MKNGYAPDYEEGLIWNNVGINVQWSIDNPVVSSKDQRWGTLRKLVERAVTVNTIGALNVAEITNEIGAINVYISMDYYTEKDIPTPLNVHGLSKYAGEIFAMNYPRKYLIRVVNLYEKARVNGKGRNFEEFIIQKAKRRKEIRVVNDMFMSPTYIKDVTKTLKRCLELKLEFGVYNLMNERCWDWYKFTKVIFRILGWDVEVKSIKSSKLKRLVRKPEFSALKNEKLKIG